MNAAQLPNFVEWSTAAVRLLQGVIYYDDPTIWDLVLKSQSPLENYFARIGLLLVIDEGEGLAYLRQMGDDELPAGYEPLPKLFRKTALSYGATLLAVLLRDALRRFEDDVHNERCVVETAPLFDDWKTFFPPQSDEVRARKELATAINKLEELGFIKRFGDQPEAWEIRKILKARLPVSELEQLKLQLTQVSPAS